MNVQLNLNQINLIDEAIENYLYTVALEDDLTFRTNLKPNQEKIKEFENI